MKLQMQNVITFTTYNGEEMTMVMSISDAMIVTFVIAQARKLLSVNPRVPIKELVSQISKAVKENKAIEKEVKQSRVLYILRKLYKLN